VVALADLLQDVAHLVHPAAGLPGKRSFACWGGAALVGSARITVPISLGIQYQDFRAHKEIICR
jgi:hypothetical protein